MLGNLWQETAGCLVSMFCFRNVIKLINFDKKVNNRIIQTGEVGAILLSL